MSEERLMEKSQIHEIPLEQIRPAPWNPPSRMDPARVQELADSIKKEGQKQNALVRPVEAEAPVRYELVFGHRRYAAKKLLSQKVDANHAVLRCEIEEMIEERAMILSGIENLQRQGFSDVEEAEFFRMVGEQYGESAVKILSEKLSVSDRYVRKRIEFLKLPKAALELWRSGTWHIGHMEQLLRLGSNDQVEAFLVALTEDRRVKPEDLAVYQMKDMVDHLAVPLHSGRFDKGDCKGCRKNTDIQRRLFGSEKEKTKCLDQKCFLAKQQAWLTLYWPGCKENKQGTVTAVIGDYNTKITGKFDVHYSGGDPVAGEKCQSCSKYASIVRHNLEPVYYSFGRVCIGESSCYEEIKSAGKKTKKAEKKEQVDAGGPRVAWHGEHFRQQFYQEEIPELMTGLAEDDPRHLQLTLATILYLAKTFHEWFWLELGKEVPEKEDWQTFWLPFPKLLNAVQTLEPQRVKALLAEILVKVALRTDRGYEISFIDADRQAMAEFLDIDFDRYQVTEEYLQKKTKAELVRFIAHDSGLAADPAFLEAMELRGYDTVEKLAGAKKPQMIDLILQCGVNLRGRLPKEIADRPKLDS